MEKENSINLNRNQEEQFIIKKWIGQGTFGKVAKCVRKCDDKIVALKIIDTNIDKEIMRQEAEIMKKIKSDYTLQLLDHFYDEQQNAYILVLPFCRKGSLSNLMNFQWELKDILLLLYQIHRAFIDISQRGWHLDLKPDNILIKAQGEFVVCDFGCAQLLDNAKQSQILRLSMNKGGGTTSYAAPELVLNWQGSKYSDIWSLGIILYELIYKKHPLKKEGSHYTTILQDFSHNKLKIDYPQISQYRPVIEMCKKMLVSSSNKIVRMTWQQLGKNIYGTIGIHPRIPIVTDMDQFVEYAVNINTIISGLIYYIQLNAGLLNAQKIQYKQLIETAKTIMHVHIQNIILTLQQSQNYQHYYLFPKTIKNYTQTKVTKLQHISQRTRIFTKSLIIERINSYLNIKQNFICLCDDFLSAVKFIKNDKPQNQWHKVIKILKIIKQGIDYSNKDSLKRFAKELIYN